MTEIEPTKILKRSDDSKLEYFKSGKGELFALVYTSLDGKIYISKKDISESQLFEIITDFEKNVAIEKKHSLEKQADNNRVFTFLFIALVVYFLYLTKFNLVFASIMIPVACIIIHQTSAKKRSNNSSNKQR